MHVIGRLDLPRVDAERLVIQIQDSNAVPVKRRC